MSPRTIEQKLQFGWTNNIIHIRTYNQEASDKNVGLPKFIDATQCVSVVTFH
jgi:hypothetical protein